MPITFTAKRRNIAKWLAENYGGKWTYDHFASWWCDDGKRHVSRVHVCDHDDSCNCPPAYCLYGPYGSEWVYP